MKTNKIMFTILVIIFIIISCLAFREAKNITSYRTKDSISIDKCGSHTKVVQKYDDLSKCDTFNFEELDPKGVDYDVWINSNDKYNSLSLKDCCNAYKNNIPLSPDYYTIFYFLYTDARITTDFYIYIIGLILFFALYGINKLFRSKYLFYYVQREKYKKFIIKNILKSYSYVFSIVIYFLLLYIFSRTMSNHLDRTYLTGTSTFSEIYYGNKYFLIFFCIQNCLMCLTFINVGLVFLKNNRLIFTIMETYIVYFIVIMILSAKNMVPLNILFDGKEVNIYTAVLWSLFYFGLSLIPVVITYRNKEDVLTKLDRSKQ